MKTRTILYFTILLSTVFAAVSSRADQWIRSDTILTLADGQPDPIDGYIQISDTGTIVAVEAGELPDAIDGTVVDARGKIIIPGFVSGHNHLWQSAFRGLAGDKELYGWLQSLHWTFGKHFKDGDMYAFTLYGALDQLEHGITTTLNHSQTVAPTYANYLEQFKAEMDAGQHFVFSYVLDWKDGDAESRKQKLLDLMQDTTALKQPHACLDFGLHGVGIYRSAEKHQMEVALAKELNLDMQIHYLEEKANSLDEGQAKFTAMKADEGVWDGLVYAHFIHVTEDILKTSAEAGAKMIWNPLSNGRLASGLADIPGYLEAGLAVGMGVDGSASADVCDPFQNMRMGMYALRMRDSSAAVMSTYDILRLHTIKTAEVLEVSDRVGSLEVGKYADLLIITPKSPIFDPYGTLVFATSASDIDSVWVRGTKRVEDGTVLDHDMKVLETEMAQRVNRIVADQKAAESMQ